MNSQRSPIFAINIKESQALKGVAILFVLLGHLYYLYTSAGGVDLFLILSGYGLCSSADAKGLGGYWKKKLRDVYLPYLLVILFEFVFLGANSVKQIVFSVFTLDFNANIDKTMWYISFLFLWYVFFAAVSKVVSFFSESPQSTQRWIRTALLFCCSIPCYILNRVGVWHIAAGATLYVFAFPIGSLLYCLSNISIKKQLKIPLWCCLLILSLFSTVSLYSKEFSYMKVYAIFALSEALIPLSLSQIVDEWVVVEKLLSKLGDYAYAIYLFEGFFIFLSESWFAFIHIKLLSDLAKLACTFVCAVLFWRFLFPAIKKVIQPKKTQEGL